MTNTSTDDPYDLLEVQEFKNSFKQISKLLSLFEKLHKHRKVNCYCVIHARVMSLNFLFLTIY